MFKFTILSTYENDHDVFFARPKTLDKPPATAAYRVFG